MLGDIVISVETAARQAEERGLTLIDEIRILMVGLYYLLLTFIKRNNFRFWLVVCQSHQDGKKSNYKESNFLGTENLRSHS